MPSASGGSGPMSWKACEPAWRQGWRCTISVSGSTSNLVVLGWLSLICWSGDLNSHQAFKRTSQLDYAIVERCDRFGADRVRPADEGGVVGGTLQIQPAELAQNDGVINEAFGLFVAPSIESLDHQHPQDHLDGRGMATE